MHATQPKANSINISSCKSTFEALKRLRHKFYDVDILLVSKIKLDLFFPYGQFYN